MGSCTHRAASGPLMTRASTMCVEVTRCNCNASTARTSRDLMKAALSTFQMGRVVLHGIVGKFIYFALCIANLYFLLEHFYTSMDPVWLKETNLICSGCLDDAGTYHPLYHEWQIDPCTTLVCHLNGITTKKTPCIPLGPAPHSSCFAVFLPGGCCKEWKCE